MKSSFQMQEVDLTPVINGFLQLPVIATGLERLDRELPETLKYHTADHARDVMHDTILFATMEGVAGDDLEDLAIAAAFHDAGFIETTGDNEAIAADIAEEAMKAHGYSDARITRVKRMILDTQLVETPKGRLQVPHHALSPYLLDGDLSNLGRPDFFEKLSQLQRESFPEGKPSLDVTHSLLRNHEWFTEAARTLRGAQKLENLRQLEEMMAK